MFTRNAAVAHTAKRGSIKNFPSYLNYTYKKKNLCKQCVHISSCGVCRPRAVQRTVYRMNLKKKKKRDKNNKILPLNRKYGSIRFDDDICLFNFLL